VEGGLGECSVGFLGGCGGSSQFGYRIGQGAGEVG